MQKEQSETPKRHVRRVHKALNSTRANTSTLDSSMVNGNATNSRYRSTMGPADFAQSHLKDFPLRKRTFLSRKSILPPQLQLESSKPIEGDNSDTQSKLLYDEYLQGVISGYIVQKKMEETENWILHELATVVTTIEHDEEKLSKLKLREADIVHLSAVQNELDGHIGNVIKYITNTDIIAIKEKLSELYSCLQPLDILKCRNFILPKTREEWKKVEKILKQCISILNSIADLIGSKGDTYKYIYNGILDFIKTHSEIENHHRRLQKALCNLQIIVLKIASLSLKEDGDLIDM